MDPSLKNVLAAKTLQWIFVGGKGGVGKTTTSCSLGIQLAAVRRSVLIVSTDPAHNLSDAFDQKFGRTPQLVSGFTNLYCMEIDAAATLAEEGALAEAASAAGGGAEGGDGAAAAAGLFGGLMKEFSNAIPGIDEAMSFMELMKHTRRMEFEVTVFDTAPTGHTLRLLALPGTLDRAMAKLGGLRDRFGGMLAAAQGLMGGAAGGMPPAEVLFAKLDEMRGASPPFRCCCCSAAPHLPRACCLTHAPPPLPPAPTFAGAVGEVQSRLRNPAESTFVCVCIPEFLSLYETERLVQELTRYEIDTHNIVVNQVLFVDAASSTCKRCLARNRMQAKYMEQIGDLYEDFNVVRTPLLNEEVRGTAKLRAFSNYLREPYALGDVLPPVLEEGGGRGGGGGGGGS